MAAPAETYGGLNVNDGTTYNVTAFDPGSTPVAYDEVPNYAGGANRQVNVQRTGLVLMLVEILVQGANATTRDAAIAALNAKLAATNDWVHNDGAGNVTYHCLVSGDCTYPRDAAFFNLFRARCTLPIVRQP